MAYRGNILADRDFLFKPKYKYNLSSDGGVFAYLIDLNISFV